MIKVPLLKITDPISSEPWIWFETCFCPSEFIKLRKLFTQILLENPKKTATKLFTPK